MNARILQLALLTLVAALAACSSTQSHPSAVAHSDPALSHYGIEQSNFDPATDPYWEDPRWDSALLNDIQSVVHDPVDASDLSTPSFHGSVKFTFLNGTIEYPEIVESTGNPDLDKLMLHQVASAPAPQSSGPHAAEAHEFVLQLDMPTPYEAFEYSVFDAIDRWKVYPKNAILGGVQATNTIDFDYLDGIVSNITLARSSKNKDLDKASTQAVSRAEMPPPPAAYAGKPLHMEVTICYSLNENDTCPSVRHSVQVRGTRIRRVG